MQIQETLIDRAVPVAPVKQSLIMDIHMKLYKKHLKHLGKHM